jgi:hypothetical protein
MFSFIFGKNNNWVKGVCVFVILLCTSGFAYLNSNSLPTRISNFEIKNYQGANFVKKIPLFNKEIVEDSLLEANFEVSYSDKSRSILNFDLAGCITEMIVEGELINLNSKNLDTNGFGFESCNNFTPVQIDISKYVQPNKNGIVSLVFLAQKPSTSLVFQRTNNLPWSKLILLFLVCIFAILLFILL